MKSKAQDSLPWLRLYTEMLFDPKIRSLSAVEKWVWIGLLVLASRGKPRGTIHICENVPYDMPLLGSMLDLYNEEQDCLAPALEKMKRLDMISIDDRGIISITHFDERQYEYVSGLPKSIQERVRKHRALKRKGNENVTGKHHVTNCNDIDTDTDTETEIDKDIRLANIISSEICPQCQQVKAICECEEETEGGGDERSD